MESTLILSLAGVILGFLNFCLISYGAYITQKHFSYIRTFTAIERYNSEEYRKHKLNYTKILSKLDAAENKEDYIKDLLYSMDDENIDKRSSLTNILNLLQEVSAAYELGILNQQALMLTFGSIIPRYYFPVKDIIAVFRQIDKDETVYGTLEKIAIQLDAKYKYVYSRGI